MNILREDKHLVKILKQVRSEQKNYKWLNRVKDKLESGDIIVNKFFIEEDGLIFCKKGINSFWKLCIPNILVTDIIFEMHYRHGHVGVDKTFRILNETFYIKDCRRKINSVLRNCSHCQYIKGNAIKRNEEMHKIIC